MRVIPLGTNGFFGSFGRETMCFTIPHGKTLVVLDAGSGMFRFAEPMGKKLLIGVNEIHLFLSHYHQDHTFGLYAAFKLFEGKKIRVFAPDGKQEFNAFTTTQDFPEQYVKEYPNFSWNMLGEGRVQLSGYQVTVRKQKHRDGMSLAYRFRFSDGKKLAYITDSESTPESVDFVSGVDLLLHEHYFPGRDKMIGGPARIAASKANAGGHVTTIGAAAIAKEAGVGKLALVHHNPFSDETVLKEQLHLAQSIFPQTILGMDLEKISF